MVCTCESLRPAWAFWSGLSLFNVFYPIQRYCKWTTNILIRLHKCAVWTRYSLCTCETNPFQTKYPLPHTYTINWKSPISIVMWFRYSWRKMAELRICKQWRPRSDATWCGIWSGSALFVNYLLGVSRLKWVKGPLHLVTHLQSTRIIIIFFFFSVTIQ